MAAVIRFPTERTRKPEPPPANPALEIAAFWLAAWAEWLHAMSAMLRPPR